MNLFAVFIGLAMLALALPIVVKPFQHAQGKNTALLVKRVRPEEQRLAALTALRDLDFDYQVGKVSENDYTGLRSRLVAEAARYLQDDKNDEIEAMIQARKSSKAKGAVCAHCGKPLEAGNLFCPHCGEAVADSCPSCGKKIKASDLYCKSCGTRLTVQTGTAV